MFAKLWKDEAGFVVSAELIFIATLLVIGLVTGWVAIRNAAVSELTEVALALANVDQSYSYTGASNCASMTSGAAVTDADGLIGTASAVAAPSIITISLCP